MKNIVAAVQARMGSKRLPGKVLRPILGKPMLSYIVGRLQQVSAIEGVVVATSERASDEPIYRFCVDAGIECFRGDEENVLDRFYKAVTQFTPNHVIRVTADCPLIDPAIIRRLISFYFENGYDHAGVATGAAVSKKGFTARYPDGLDTEIFSFRALEEAWKKSSKPLHREHVTPFIWQQPELFRLGQLKSEKDYSDLRLTVDTLEDFELIRWIYEQLYPKNPFFGLAEVLKLLEEHPRRARSNKYLIGNEGYEEFWK